MTVISGDMSELEEGVQENLKKALKKLEEGKSTTEKLVNLSPEEMNKILSDILPSYYSVNAFYYSEEPIRYNLFISKGKKR